MIANLVKGRGFLGVASYLLHGRKKNESRWRGRVLASNMAGRTAKELAWEFRRVASLRPRLGKAVFHASLSLAPEDRALNEIEWRDLAQRFLNELGFAECPFVAIRHSDTEHDHIHILSSRVSTSGKAISDQNDFRRAEKILRSIEADFGLRRVNSSHNNNQKMEGTMIEPNRKIEVEEIEQGPEKSMGTMPMIPMMEVECGDRKLTEKKRRNYKRKLLEEAYSRQVAMMLGDAVRFIERRPGSLVIHISNDGKLTDQGDLVSASSMSEEDAAERLVLLCVAKGWEGVVFRGSDRFLRAAMAAAVRKGLNVCPLDDSQAAILCEIQRQHEVEQNLAMDAIQVSEITCGEISTRHDEYSGLAGLAGRLDAMRTGISPFSRKPSLPWKKR